FGLGVVFIEIVGGLVDRQPIHPSGRLALNPVDRRHDELRLPAHQRDPQKTGVVLPCGIEVVVLNVLLRARRAENECEMTDGLPVSSDLMDLHCCSARSTLSGSAGAFSSDRIEAGAPERECSGAGIAEIEELIVHSELDTHRALGQPRWGDQLRPEVLADSAPCAPCEVVLHLVDVAREPVELSWRAVLRILRICYEGIEYQYRRAGLTLSESTPEELRSELSSRRADDREDGVVVLRTDTPPMSARVLVPALEVRVAERRRDEAIFEDTLRVAAPRPIDDCADPAVREGRSLTEPVGAAGRTVVMRNAELQDQVLEAS